MPDATDPAAIARRYAEAYAAFDIEQLLDVLAPDPRFRQVNPGGYLELDSTQAYVNATQAFLDRYDSHAAADATAARLADRILTTSRIHMLSGGGRYLMQHSEIVTVTDGKVTRIDSVCTGALGPVPHG